MEQQKQTVNDKHVDIDSYNDMISPSAFANKWKGPVWIRLKENGPIKHVNIKDMKSIEKFFKNNADSYISRHDVRMFKKWSVNVVHAALKHIKDKE